MSPGWGVDPCTSSLQAQTRSHITPELCASVTSDGNLPLSHAHKSKGKLTLRIPGLGLE